MSGVALLPWTARDRHVGGTLSGRRENVEAPPGGGRPTCRSAFLDVGVFSCCWNRVLRGVTPGSRCQASPRGWVECSHHVRRRSGSACGWTQRGRTRECASVAALRLGWCVSGSVATDRSRYGHTITQSDPNLAGDCNNAGVINLGSISSGGGARMTRGVSGSTPALGSRVCACPIT